MTPRFRQEMIYQVSSECNRIYRLYKEKNPDFNGTVSIYGHSLGSVLAFDILSHDGTNPADKPPNMNRQSSVVDISDLSSSNLALGKPRYKVPDTPEMKYEHLDFEMNQFFGMLS